ncbi:2-dehydro-3-deoxy-D-arabinonate dehydratase [Nocardioides luteus]|uniref:Fumarylacetoacetate hydrolase n=1 Tax=Nocardioides luteus TaxID=1844 RepID=A0ABQ5SWU4_9ACTN|nr:fumarylacetoacetate hydrolase family protein [Nocardioides luteus]MDR7311805.1 2-dehydro-3-deoxy-D-arabinonate dehydratase [Nocardioides luteus]GGR71781.1 fumarylacetoacetate (FAA) hydrolase [Nocardioides luteus]GLJ68048.1 fumarylacetoacetate hydrolase [Nocardioides luteus]
MHLVRYDRGDGPRVGVRQDDSITPLAGVASMAELLALPLDELRATVESATAAPAPAGSVHLLAPLDGRAELWCAGVTYACSRSARMEESEERSVYDKVYSAQRPELFLKAPAWRLVTDGDPVGIRADSGHDVPEPELAVVANAHGEIVGYTVCNDMSSRSIEGENPLYLSQAKVYAGGAALATGIRPAWEVPDATDLAIRLAVRRDGRDVIAAETSTEQLVRPIQQLVDYLFVGNDFPDGAALATGTGIVPDFDFSLRAGDTVEIEIAEVGRLVNRVEAGKEPFAWLSR